MRMRQWEGLRQLDIRLVSEVAGLRQSARERTEMVGEEDRAWRGKNAEDKLAQSGRTCWQFVRRAVAWLDLEKQLGESG